MPDNIPDQQFPGLSLAQADGRACVVCGRRLRGKGLVWQPVGRSHTGSQVFACAGTCASTATAPDAVVIPEGALSVAGSAFNTALDAAGGDVHRAWPDDLVTATVTAAAPLIVATELRRLAASSAVQHGESPGGVRVAVLPVADLTARANTLDPLSGGERR
jgi:hypothetical protein